MNKLDAMLDKLPHFYNIDPTSNIYKILNALSNEFDIIYDDYISRIDSDIDVYTTAEEDLEWRWGNLLGIKRGEDEPVDIYRNRLALVTNTLHGGTADSLKFAIAIFLRLTDNPAEMDKCIHIFDGWLCTDTEATSDMKQNGHVICIFSFSELNRDIAYYDGIENDVIAYINSVKAAGITAHVIVKYTLYSTLENYTYGQLEAYTYDQLEKWSV